MNSMHRSLAALMVGGLLAISGCEGGSPPSVTSATTEATVKGKVTLGGKPASGGEVVFDPSNYQRKMESARTAKIGADGTYTIKTLVGQNSIRLGGDAIQKQMPMATRRSWDLDVKGGDNTFDIDVPAEEAAK